MRPRGNITALAREVGELCSHGSACSEGRWNRRPVGLVPTCAKGWDFAQSAQWEVLATATVHFGRGGEEGGYQAKTL